MSVTTEAEIIPFPSRQAPAANRMSVRDRIEALRWADQAAEFGYSRVLLDTSEADSDIDLGDYLLVYRKDATFATWGIGCTGGGFMLWCPQTGVTVAQFRTLSAALERIRALS